MCVGRLLVMLDCSPFLNFHSQYYSDGGFPAEAQLNHFYKRNLAHAQTHTCGQNCVNAKQSKCFGLHTSIFEVCKWGVCTRAHRLESPLRDDIVIADSFMFCEGRCSSSARTRFCFETKQTQQRFVICFVTNTAVFVVLCAFVCKQLCWEAILWCHSTVVHVLMVVLTTL